MRHMYCTYYMRARRVLAHERGERRREGGARACGAAAAQPAVVGVGSDEALEGVIHEGEAQRRARRLRVVG